MPQTKKFTILILLFVLTLSTGCMRYYRLLAFKKQLKTLDESFEFIAYDGLKINAREPVLKQEDIRWLSAAPSSVEESEENARWVMNFRNLNPEYSSDAKLHAVQVDLLFANDMLERVELPREFTRLIPTALLKYYLKTVGHSKINIAKRRLSTDKNDGVRPPRLHFPRYEDFLEVLGKPSEIQEEERNIFTCKFKYQLEGKDDWLKPELTVSFKKHLNAFQQAKFKFGPYFIRFDDRTVTITLPSM